jgi:hypothetical protein
MKLDGSDLQRLTDFSAMSWAPFYHPSGKYVIFTSNKLGFDNFELYLVDAPEGKRVPLRVTYATNAFDGLPVFSPDGKRLCWSSGRTPDGKSQLFLANWNHEAALAALAWLPFAGKRPAEDPRPNPVADKPAHSLSTDITIEDLRTEVAYLASDALEGRMTGAKGARMAADYIEDYFRNIGLQPARNSSSNYFQSFEFTAGVRVVTNRNDLRLIPQKEGAGITSLAVEKDFRPLSFTANSEVEGDVVFAGYGLFVPGKPGEGYDSYAGLEVTNKIVLALRYVPEDVEPRRRQELNRYASLRYKAMMARERGAKAILFVTGPNSPNAGELVGLTFDSSLAGSGIVAASISSNAANAILSSSGKELKSLQGALDKENPHAEGGFQIPKLRVGIGTTVEHIRKTDRNVVAVLPPAGDPRHTEYVLVGAHYDHLGFGEAGAMQRQGEEGKIHNGADDNASGTAATLELAASLAKERESSPESFRRGIIFALWSGEEVGLIGSSYFAEHPPVPLSNVVGYVNFDMVGRLNENTLILQGVGSSALWRRLIEKRNVAAGFNLVLQDDPYLPTDVTALYPKQVPVLNFFTGSHEDYHRPTDDAEKINYDGLQRIVQFARGLIVDLARGSERPDYVKVQRSGPASGSRENLRAYLGTVPDYAAEGTGVKLSDVRGGSPAAKGGLKGGDIIVEFGGQKIANIYDYTYALDAVKIGQVTEITVSRDGNRVKFKVTPEARK